jgi:hypothetical protein
MDYKTICDKIIEPKLTDMLGKVLTARLVQKARFAAVEAGSDRQKLEKFVSTTCSDSHFIGFWGTAQAAKQAKEWLNLYR